MIKENSSSLVSHPEAVKIGLMKRVEHVSTLFGTSRLLKTQPVKTIFKEDT